MDFVKGDRVVLRRAETIFSLKVGTVLKSNKDNTVVEFEGVDRPVELNSSEFIKAE